MHLTTCSSSFFQASPSVSLCVASLAKCHNFDDFAGPFLDQRAKGDLLVVVFVF